MTNLKEHWGQVRAQWRHISTSMNGSKKERIVGNFHQYIAPKMHWDDINVCLDWGCGGGVLSKELKKMAEKVIVADICTHSLDKCQEFAAPDAQIVIPNELSKFEYTHENPDFILAHAIVWHFPSVMYFKEVMDIWSQLGPKYIALNTKTTGKDFIETSDYQKGFLNALLLGDEFVINLFGERGFKLISSKTVTTGLQPQTYFVFEKK